MRLVSRVVRVFLVIAAVGLASAMIVSAVASAEPSDGDGGGPTGTPTRPHSGGTGFIPPVVKTPPPPVISCNCVTVHPTPTPPSQVPLTPVPQQNQQTYVPQATPSKTAPASVTPPPPVEVTPLATPPPLAPPPAPVYSVKNTSSVSAGPQALTVILVFLFVGTWFYANRIGSAWSLRTALARTPLAEKDDS